MKNRHLERRLVRERIQDGFILPEVYAKYRKMVDASFPNLSEEEKDAETRVICHTHPDSPHVQKPAPDPKLQPAQLTKESRLIAGMFAAVLILLQLVALLLGFVIYLLIFSEKAHAAGSGTSQIDVIKATDGTHTVVAAAPFKISFSGCTVGGTGSAWTITCAQGGTNNPGGSLHQIQTNAGTSFGGIANGTAGQVLCSNGASLDPSMCDPIVSGPDAVAATPSKNPVQAGCVFLTTPTTLTNNQVGELECDTAQNLLVKVVNALTVTANAGTNLNTSALALESGGNLATLAGIVSSSKAAVKSADGDLATIGAKADAKSTATDTTAISMMQVLKEISAMAQAPATTPISAASLPLPTGAAADSSLTTLDTDVKSNVTLHSGTNLIGKAGFDNTTPGTTNGVSMAQPTRTTGTITTSSTSIPVASTGYGVATVTVNGTYAGITVNFEFSDDGGTTYYSDTCTRTDTNVQESSEALPSNQTRAWDCGVFAATNFRVRSSAYTSGTANIGITLSAAPIEPAPTVSVNGTVPVSAASLPLPSGAATSANQCGASGPCQVSATSSANGATNPIFTRETDGTNPVILDPCRTQANIFKPISQTASAQLVTGTSAKKIYICSINLVTAGANNVAMVEGTGSTCGTGTAGMAGGTTAATGWNFAANGGLTQGNGMGSIMAEATNADNLCLLQSAAVQLSGVIGYVVQ